MPATDLDPSALRDRIAALEAELADERRRHHGLRHRKAVRAALAVAGVRDKARAALGRRPPTGPAPPQTPPPVAPATTNGVAHIWDLGHFYSPVPDTRELATEPRHSRVWPEQPRETPGVDWRGERQVELVRAIGAQPPMPFPMADTGDPTEYHTANPNFSSLDAWVLQGVLRHVKPARVIEVGCGWSTLVTARVNREHFGGAIDVTCIEPYPLEFVTDGIDGVGRLIATQVQDVPLSTFEALGDGDVLFIDTSHVIKTGNDVQFLYQEVVPRLRPGVVVHIHDVFLPWDYPQDWVLGGRAWNEQYLVESFLAFNTDFEVLLGVGWMSCFRHDVLADAAGDAVGEGGGSLWLRRRAA